MCEAEQRQLNQHLIRLKKEAVLLGATAADVIGAGDIRTDEKLAGLCNGEYICPNYGLAASCPPWVKGPGQFKTWQAESRYAVTVKIELPASLMFSDERNDVMRLLHTVVTGVEQRAVELGFKKSRAFAGGSCKPLFCDGYKTCCVVENRQPCRHPDKARPSMSGFGIDVVRLMEASGWSAEKAKPDSDNNEEMSWVAGLILIA